MIATRSDSELKQSNNLGDVVDQYNDSQKYKDISDFVARLIVGAFTRLRSPKPADGADTQRSHSLGIFADNSLSESRYAICSECDRLKPTKFCGCCGCYMPAKTKIASASCPLGKWAADKR